jgi:hypothetical protein
LPPPESNDPPRPRRNWPVASVLLTALLTGIAYVYGGWLRRHELYLAPLAIALPLVAFVSGVYRSRSDRPLRRLGSGAFWVAATITALLLWPAAHLAWLRREAAAIPLPSPAYGASSGHWVIDPVRFNDRPDIAIRYISDAPLSQAESLYRERLPALGWTPADVDRIDTFRPDSFYRAQRTLTFERRGRTLRVRITEAADKTEIGIELFDPRPGQSPPTPGRPANMLG